MDQSPRPPTLTPQAVAEALHTLLDPNEGALTTLTGVLETSIRAAAHYPGPGAAKALAQLAYARDDLVALCLHIATAADALTTTPDPTSGVQEEGGR